MSELTKTDTEILQSRLDAIEAELKDRELEVDALRQIGQAIGALFDIEEMLKRVADIVVQVTGTDLCVIYLLDEARNELVLRASSRQATGIIGKLRLKVGEGVTGWVARERRLVALDKEAWNDYRFKHVPGFLEDYESMLSVPLCGKENLVGVVNVRTATTHEYTPTQIRLLNSIAEQVGGAVENFLQYQRMKKQASHLTTLTDISRTISSEDMYLEEVLHLIVAMTADSMNFKICSVMLLDENRDELVIKATQSKSRAYIKKPNLKLAESVAGRAVMDGQAITILDVRKTPGYRYPDIAKKEGLCSLIAVPMRIKGKVIGVLNCYTSKPHVFTDEEKALLEAMASHAAMAIENSKLKVRSAIIREMHHRVKNSLQTIASLLRLQIRYGKFESVEQVLNESINRVLAIASVHELLSGDNLDNVSIKKVADGVLAATARGMIPPDKRIEICIEGDDIILPARQATSVALILNELLQNAIEHGFKYSSWGKVVMSLKEDGDKIRLSVTNNGELLPPGFDLHNHRNLGLQIVENLVVDDLNGTFSLTNDRNVIKALVIFTRQ